MHMDNPGSAETASRALSGKVVDGKALVVRQRSQAPGSGGGGPGKLPVVLCCAAVPKKLACGVHMLSLSALLAQQRPHSAVVSGQLCACSAKPRLGLPVEDCLQNCCWLGLSSCSRSCSSPCICTCSCLVSSPALDSLPAGPPRPDDRSGPKPQFGLGDRDATKLFVGGLIPTANEDMLREVGFLIMRPAGSVSILCCSTKG